MGLLPEVFWSLTMREFALAVQAYMENDEAARDRVEWQTAHIMCSFRGGSPRSILREWRQGREGTPEWLKPPEKADERFLKKIADRSNGRNGNHSKV